ncbi:MAG TPA: ATP-binding protein [Candidatus Obscuribacterales bacterium]
MRKAQGAVSIGDLLTKAGLVTDQQLRQALAISTRTGASVGSVLVDTGVLSANTSRAAVLAQSLVREDVLPVEVATYALQVVQERNIAFEEALEYLGWRSDYQQVTNRLGQLLYKAGIVAEPALNAAIDASYASGLPLGRVLVLRKVIPESVAYAALTAQVLIREGKITQAQAIEALQASIHTRKTLEETLENEGILPRKQKKTVRLGELLIVSGLVSEIDLLSAVEKGMLEEKPIGQVLLSLNLIDPPMLDRALSLQNMVNAQQLNPFEAATMLQDFKNNPGAAEPVPAADFAPAPDGAKPLQPQEIPEMLRVFGLYNEKDLLSAVQDLLLEKQNLAYRVVSQQDEMKLRLARDLHDTVIADLMMLKRYISGDKKLSNEQIIEIVDHVIRQIRDLCSDFAPRHLKDWGLKMSVEDMLQRMSQRTGIAATLVCGIDLPQLPEPVELHIFRIFQEGLNNVEKYSGASKVIARIDAVDENTLRFSLEDNGKGFDPDSQEERKPESGGMGMGGMKERADLIRCFYPTRLYVDSQPGSGSLVALEVTIR